MKTWILKWRTDWAVKHLSKQLQRDPGFRDSWHANIAMPIYDATHPPTNLKQFDPMPIERCNQIADKLLEHLFDAPQFQAALDREKV